jgi:hypothetical protein
MAPSSIQHLQSLQTLLQALAPEGIELESHQYDSLAFGGFELVLAKNHKKARFLWDGRESLLEVQYQEVDNKAIVGKWVHDAFIKVTPAEAVFAEIGSEAEAILQ